MNFKQLETTCLRGTYDTLFRYLHYIKTNHQYIIKKRFLFYCDLEQKIILPTHKLMVFYDLNQNNTKHYEKIKYLKQVSQIIKQTVSISNVSCKFVQKPQIQNVCKDNKYYLSREILEGQYLLCIDTEFLYPWNKNYNKENQLSNIYEFGCAYLNNDQINKLLFRYNTEIIIANALQNVIKANNIKYVAYYACSKDKLYFQHILQYNNMKSKFIYINMLPIMKAYFPNSISYNLLYLHKNIFKYDTKILKPHQADTDAQALLEILQYIYRHTK